ncbi:predicted protein [Nematostella vectensis]|uniref:Uncharacterized protein n=1 Tax=Nematostella vectensis TaxID=45351 RepID=A7T141_NEMVE|nr:predicted protein [Nematostella vectensis]|eukprot:XP_001622417.1 predicted protein [Nematostella vectensis]
MKIIPIFVFVLINFFVILLVFVIYSCFTKRRVERIKNHETNDAERQPLQPTQPEKKTKLVWSYIGQLTARILLGIIFMVSQTGYFYPHGFPSNFECRSIKRQRNSTAVVIANITYDCYNQAASKKKHWVMGLLVVNGVFAFVAFVEFLWVLYTVKRRRACFNDLQFYQNFLGGSNKQQLKLSNIISKMKTNFLEHTKRLADLRTPFRSNPGEGRQPHDLETDKIYVNVTIHKNRATMDFPHERSEQLKVYPPKRDIARLYRTLDIARLYRTLQFASYISHARHCTLISHGRHCTLISHARHCTLDIARLYRTLLSHARHCTLISYATYRTLDIARLYRTLDIARFYRTLDIARSYLRPRPHGRLRYQATDAGLLFNETKCKAQRFTRKKKPVVTNYTTKTKVFEEVETERDLGTLHAYIARYISHATYGTLDIARLYRTLDIARLYRTLQFASYISHARHCTLISHGRHCTLISHARHCTLLSHARHCTLISYATYHTLDIARLYRTLDIARLSHTLHAYIARYISHATYRTLDIARLYRTLDIARLYRTLQFASYISHARHCTLISHARHCTLISHARHCTLISHARHCTLISHATYHTLDIARLYRTLDIARFYRTLDIARLYRTLHIAR